ncbi:hypothetical protein [Gluconobacter oxydans]|uniref:hypothetical protein n=1 Tax=Gluconobacter oxydans TaxID=442 RepID=UPI001CD87694|nr:hypothetical protein [Gluconobacter oxydans]
MTIQEIANRSDLWGEGPSPDKETIYRLLEENCWLERAPFGREQSRWFVTDKAVEGGYGQTVDPSNLHSFTISGPKKSFPFPVFYEDKVLGVVWTLGWDAILDHLKTLATQKERLAWLMAQHSYLPNKAIAGLSGANVRTVERKRPQNVGCQLYTEKTSNAPKKVDGPRASKVPYDPKAHIHPILLSLLSGANDKDIE